MGREEEQWDHPAGAWHQVGPPRALGTQASGLYSSPHLRLRLRQDFRVGLQSSLEAREAKGSNVPSNQ